MILERHMLNRSIFKCILFVLVITVTAHISDAQPNKRTVEQWDIFELSLNGPQDGNPFLDWEYYPDFASNTWLYIADVSIPSDPHIVHQVRERLWAYRYRQSLLESAIEFISKLGANPDTVDMIFSQTNSQLKDVDRKYLSQDFEGALSLINQLIRDLDEALDLAYQAKDRTLFWIYIVEWFALTGTSIFAGILVWTIMIKRQLYREVETTRLARLARRGVES